MLTVLVVSLFFRINQSPRPGLVVLVSGVGARSNV